MTLFKLLNKALLSNIDLCFWLVQFFTRENTIQEFFLDCPIVEARCLAVNLLKNALDRVCQRENVLIALLT